jgi:predicted DNA-binding transcriptional regulator YafY
MSSAKSHATLSRQWELLSIIPKRGLGKSAAELTQVLKDAGFQVTKRTVERDLNDLSRIFLLQTDDSQKPQLWCWLNERKIQYPGISVAEAMILQIVEGTLKQMLPPNMLTSLSGQFQQARTKLQALEESNQNARLLDKIAVVSPSLPMSPPNTPTAHYEEVQKALSANLQLKARYTSVKDLQTKEYVLNPLGLVQRGHITYLVASIEPYSDIRLLALHRFELLALEETPLQEPQGFDFVDYLKSGALQFANEQIIELQARVRPELSRLLSEAPISADMTLTSETDGWFSLKATVHHGWQLEWWILSHSSQIEVIAPAALRQKVITKLRETQSLYPEL